MSGVEILAARRAELSAEIAEAEGWRAVVRQAEDFVRLIKATRRPVIVACEGDDITVRILRAAETAPPVLIEIEAPEAELPAFLRPAIGAASWTPPGAWETEIPAGPTVEPSEPVALDAAAEAGEDEGAEVAPDAPQAPAVAGAGVTEEPDTGGVERPEAGLAEEQDAQAPPPVEMLGGDGEDCSGIVTRSMTPEQAAPEPARAGERPAASSLPKTGGTVLIAETQPPVSTVERAAGVKLSPLGVSWREEEDAALIEALAQNEVSLAATKREVMQGLAEKLGRTYRAVDNRADRTNDRIQKRAREIRDALRKAAEPGPAPAAVEEPPPMVPVAEAAARVVECVVAQRVVAPEASADRRRECPSDLTGAERTIWKALDAIGYRDGFDADLDVDVAETFARGAKADAVALDLGVDSAALVKRYKAITACIRDDKDRIRIELQPKLLAVLRRRLADERARVAA